MAFSLREEVFEELSLFLKSIQKSLLFLSKGKTQKELLAHLCRMSWVFQHSCSFLGWEQFSRQLVQFHAFLLQIRDGNVECSLETISFLLETLDLMEQGIFVQEHYFALPSSWDQKLFFLSGFFQEKSGNFMTP